MHIETIIRDEEDAVIREIKRMSVNELLGFIDPLKVDSFYELLKTVDFETIEEMMLSLSIFFEDEELAKAVGTQLAEAGYEAAMLRQQEKDMLKAGGFERKLSNRSCYKQETVIRREAVYDKDGNIVKQRWNGGTDLRAAGIMRLALEYIQGELDSPPLFSIQNHLPMKEDDESAANERARMEISAEAWGKMRGFGVAVSGGRIGWMRDSEAWHWLGRMFPNMIDARAYNHSLNAPVLPGGFMKLNVKLTEIKSVDSEGNIISANTDGCGRIHPKHPLFAQLWRPGGYCVIQFRFINENNTFAKGILVPDERCLTDDGEPDIWMDWLQVKGVNKQHAKNNKKAGVEKRMDGYIGVIRAWDRPQRLRWSFEQLQFIKNNQETQEIISKWVDEAFTKMLRQGINGLLAGIARDNPQLNAIVEMATQIAQQSESGFNLMQISMLKKAVETRLQKVLYFIAQGAGHYSKQYVAVLDDGVPEGYVVAAGFKPGTEVVFHRFPTLLPQAIIKLKVMAPLPHHKVQGKGVRFAAYFNTKDLVHKAQGDSDGDLIGLTSDPGALILANNKIGNDRTYLVEPEGKPIFMPFNDEESLHYMSGDPRGNVGGMCIHQAKLLAVGDLAGAIAMAFPYQEAVDQAKKVIEATDFREAANLDSWTKCKDGYKFNTRIPKEEWDQPGIPEEMISEWVASRLKDAGIVDLKAQNPIAWRKANKRLKPSEWQLTNVKGNWSGGNLVHHCNNYGWHKWQEISDQFQFDNIEEVEIADLLYKFLQSKDIHFEQMRMSFIEYRNTVRNESGLNEFGKTMKRIKSNSRDEKDERGMIHSAEKDLQLKMAKMSMPQIELIWRMENTDVWLDSSTGQILEFYILPQHMTEEEAKKQRANNPNNAFRALAVPGGEISTLMGAKYEVGCTFLTGANAHRIEKLVSIAMSEENPEKKMTEIIFNGKLHGQQQKDKEKNPIHGRDCPFCKATLQDALVAAQRKKRSAVEHQFIRRIISTMNK